MYIYQVKGCPYDDSENYFFSTLDLAKDHIMQYQWFKDQPPYGSTILRWELDTGNYSSTTILYHRKGDPTNKGQGQVWETEGWDEC